jgi:hypothetical protein
MAFYLDLLTILAGILMIGKGFLNIKEKLDSFDHLHPTRVTVLRIKKDHEKTEELLKNAKNKEEEEGEETEEEENE